jgi:predicted nuclease with TOPRIM domain
MKEHIARRLEQLRAEYRKGQERLVELEQETSSVNSSMLRISGAIQILEELLERDPSNTPSREIQEPSIDRPPTDPSKPGSS